MAIVEESKRRMQQEGMGLLNLWPLESDFLVRILV